jgi:hypothetical protein
MTDRSDCLYRLFRKTNQRSYTIYLEVDSISIYVGFQKCHYQNRGLKLLFQSYKIGSEILENLETGIASFREIIVKLNKNE